MPGPMGPPPGSPGGPGPGPSGGEATVKKPSIVFMILDFLVFAGATTLAVLLWLNFF